MTTNPEVLFEGTLADVEEWLGCLDTPDLVSTRVRVVAADPAPTDEFEVYTAPDGQPAIRMKGHDGLLDPIPGADESDNPMVRPAADPAPTGPEDQHISRRPAMVFSGTADEVIYDEQGDFTTLVITRNGDSEEALTPVVDCRAQVHVVLAAADPAPTDPHDGNMRCPKCGSTNARCQPKPHMHVCLDCGCDGTTPLPDDEFEAIAAAVPGSRDADPALDMPGPDTTEGGR